MAAVQEGDTASLLRELRALILSQQQSIQELSDRVLNIESLSESVEEKLSDVQETLHGASGSIVQRRASSTITAVPPTSPNRLSSRSDDQHTDRQSPPHTAAASYSGYFVGDMINTVYIFGYATCARPLRGPPRQQATVTFICQFGSSPSTGTLLTQHAACNQSLLAAAS